MFTLPVAGSLPASKTHTARRWVFIASADPTSPSLGTVTVSQSRRDVVSYGVAVDGRQVLLANLDGQDVYGITCTPAGRPVHCTCRGFCFNRTCKHKDVTAELIADGVLTVGRPDARDPADLDAF